MLTSNIHLASLLDSGFRAFPKVFEELQQSHSFFLFKNLTDALTNAVLPLTGSFILPHATYKETRRVKGCLLTRHFPTCHSDSYTAQCAHCTLYSIFSSQPNKLGHILYHLIYIYPELVRLRGT